MTAYDFGWSPQPRGRRSRRPREPLGLGALVRIRMQETCAFLIVNEVPTIFGRRQPHDHCHRWERNREIGIIKGDNFPGEDGHRYVVQFDVGVKGHYSAEELEPYSAQGATS